MPHMRNFSVALTFRVGQTWRLSCSSMPQQGTEPSFVSLLPETVFLPDSHMMDPEKHSRPCTAGPVGIRKALRRHTQAWLSRQSIFSGLV